MIQRKTLFLSMISVYCFADGDHGITAGSSSCHAMQSHVILTNNAKLSSSPSASKTILQPQNTKQDVKNVVSVVAYKVMLGLGIGGLVCGIVFAFFATFVTLMLGSLFGLAGLVLLLVGGIGMKKNQSATSTSSATTTSTNAVQKQPVTHISATQSVQSAGSAVPAPEPTTVNDTISRLTSPSPSANTSIIASTTVVSEDETILEPSKQPVRPLPTQTENQETSGKICENSKSQRGERVSWEDLQKLLENIRVTNNAISPQHTAPKATTSQSPGKSAELPAPTMTPEEEKKYYWENIYKGVSNISIPQEGEEIKKNTSTSKKISSKIETFLNEFDGNIQDKKIMEFIGMCEQMPCGASALFVRISLDKDRWDRFKKLFGKIKGIIDDNFKKYLCVCADPNSGKTLLYVAIQYNDVEFVKELVETLGVKCLDYVMRRIGQEQNVVQYVVGNIQQSVQIKQEVKVQGKTQNVVPTTVFDTENQRAILDYILEKLEEVHPEYVQEVRDLLNNYENQ